MKKHNLAWSNLYLRSIQLGLIFLFSCLMTPFGAQAAPSTTVPLSDTGLLGANATLPVAPTPQNFMWQTLQEQFLDEAGGECRQKIALAVSDHATCYAAPGGDLRCDGSIYTQQYNFATSTGITNVDQIMLSPTFNAADGNGICVHKTDGTAWCMGSGVSSNSWGQFGKGTTGAGYAQFVQWGDRNDIARIGTGTWDQMCALTMGGDVYCSGYSFGASPVLVGTGTSFYVTTFGTVDINPPVDRASPGRTECTISSGNLNCEQTFSSTSPVVDGGPRLYDFFDCGFLWPLPFGVCLLNSGGTVECFGGAQAGQYFGTGEVLTIATNLYT